MPPKIVSDVAARIEPGSQVQCSATGTPPIYIALIQNFTLLIKTTKTTASSKLNQEGYYTCVATSKYGTDVKHLVIKGGEKIRYQTKPMQKVAIGEWRGRKGYQSSIPLITLNFSIKSHIKDNLLTNHVLSKKEVSALPILSSQP